MDADTLNNLREGEKFQRIAESEAWSELKRILADKMMDLQSIRNVDSSSAESAVLDLKARNMAIDTLMEAIREVEGRSDQHKGNKDLMEDEYFFKV